MKRWFSYMALVFRQEFKLMIHTPALLIFFIALPLAYPVVYTLIYNPEVVNKVPVAIVDDCRSTDSRELVRQASAAPAFDAYAYCANMADAKDLWGRGEVYAIMHIPYDYSKKLNSAQQANVVLYCDMSLLLRYRALLSTMTGLQIKLASDITQERAERIGVAAESLAKQPVNSDSHFLGDTQQGFASFVIPGIVVLILQQSIVLGAGLMAASARERRRRNDGIDPDGIEGAPALASVIAKALAYTIFLIPAAIYILHIIPSIFHLPHYGSPVQYLLFIFPMLLASSFLGQASVVLLREREYVFPVIAFTSVIFLFLSGLTWPRYAMTPFFTWMGNLVPATWGVEGFVRINSNAATLAENAGPYVALWILCALYCLLALLAARRVAKHP